jgi:alkanesulfonate monooxygenase SsuD/methylene tetrahydromethanopterin reductase-like flavin-dependent oxidoreductase (luciferase family)
MFMSLRFHWFLPTNGDGRDIVGGGHGVATGTAGTIRPATLAYLGQVARSAEQLGFEAALTPTGIWCEDAWLVTAMLTEVTERLKFLVAFRPGLISHEAWLQANRLIDGIDEAVIRKVQEELAHSESEGLHRMRELHGGSRDNLQVSPNLWAGIGLLRAGAGTALVGSHAEVADRIEEYARLGLSEFILSGYPHLEEAYWFAEGVLPILRERGLWQHPALPTPDGTLNATPFAPTSGPPALTVR